MKMYKMWKSVLVMFTIVALSAVIVSCDDDSPKNKKSYAISGNASGNQVVPSVDVTGTGTIIGSYNPNTRVLTYTNTWAGLTDAPTGGGFYAGASGVNGSLIGSPWTFGANTTGTGTHSGSVKLSKAEESLLLSDDWYYLYRTSANSDGEIRGQIQATQMTE